jgi:hypothetical protein
MIIIIIIIIVNTLIALYCPCIYFALLYLRAWLVMSKGRDLRLRTAAPIGLFFISRVNVNVEGHGDNDAGWG